MNKGLFIVKFTLLEVIIALAVLTLSLTGLLQLLTASQLRIAQTQEKWQYMHMLSQAAEYLMMQNEQNSDIPEDFFNYPGYHINCFFEDAEGLPDEFKDQEDQIPLKKCTIELIRDIDNKVIDRLIIDRFSYDDDEKK